MSWGHIPFIAAAVLLVIILASAGCAELPPGGSTGQSGGIPPTEEQSSGQGYNPGYLTPATPYPTAAPDVLAAPTLNRFSDTVPTTDPYVTIYQKKTKFEQTIEAYSFNLTRPPLIIEFDVEPKMITREKHTTSSYGDKDEIVVTQRYPSEDLAEDLHQDLVTPRCERGSIHDLSAHGKKTAHGIGDLRKKYTPKCRGSQRNNPAFEWPLLDIPTLRVPAPDGYIRTLPYSLVKPWDKFWRVGKVSVDDQEDI